MFLQGRGPTTAAPKGRPVAKLPMAKAPPLAGGIPRAFAGAPKLQKAAQPSAPKLQLPPILQRLNAEGRPKAPPKTAGGGFSLGSIISDIPAEIKGTGTVEKAIQGAASSFAATSTKGWQKILGSSGVGSTVAHVIGHGAGDVLELPAQVLPTLYTAGKLSANQTANMIHGFRKESPAERHEIDQLIKSYRHESVIGNLLAGDVGGAGRAFERHPGYAALEVGGGAAAADRALGVAARAGTLGPKLAAATKLADAGATSVSRAPKDLIGNVRAPQQPYSKRLSVRLAQGKPAVRPGETLREGLTGQSLSAQLAHHYDRQTATLENVRRANRSAVEAARMGAIRGKPMVQGRGLHVAIPGWRAVNPFARGLLADPRVLNEHGTPLYRDQLSRLVELHAKPVPGETGYQAHNRLGLVAEYQAMLDDPRLQKNPELAHAAAVKYAQDLRKLEPELMAHDYVTSHSMRVAKLADPFQFHWQDKAPHYDESPPLNEKGQRFVAAERARDEAWTARKGSLVEVRRADAAGDHQARAAALARHKVNVATHKAAVALAQKLTPGNPHDLHESPFSIAGPHGERVHLSVDQVEKELLEKHGVNHENIGFVSNRPFQRTDSAYYRSNTEPTKAGFVPQKTRTGAAFLRGQYDLSHDALVRQHLSNRSLVDQARGSKMQVKTYALTKAHLADLLQEKVDSLPPGERNAVKAMIAELHSGTTYFEPHGGTAAWDHAMRAISEVERLHPGLKFQPGRIAHPYAPARQLDMIARHTLEAVHDRLDPHLWEQDRGTDRFPQDETQQRLDSGPVAVYHKAIADRMKAYEKQSGQGTMNLLRQPASWWRRANVAFSVKHVPGLMQELGLRAGINAIGPLSYLRGLRRMNLIERLAEDPNFLKDHPEAALEAQRLNTLVGGTVAHQTQNLVHHVTQNQLKSTLSGTVAQAFRGAAEHKITGLPLRAVHGVLKAYSATATKILQTERKVLERPAQIAGLGKHANNEAKRIMGKSLPVFGAVTKVEREMAGGMLKQESVDHAARQMIEYWGDWTSASPRVKNALAVAPFFNWFRNSLRFMYLTMPAHHPIKTGLLTALESATAEQRRAMGQGRGAVEKLEEEQQGGIPIGGGYTAGQQYYTPPGAVTPPTTALSLILPEFVDAFRAATGTGPFGETLVNAKKQPITDAGTRAELAVSALVETFNPLVRDVATLTEGGRSRVPGSALWNLETKKGAPSEDPIGRALGIPPAIWATFRPFRTSKERTEGGKLRRGAPSGLPVINLPKVNLPKVNLPTIHVR